MQQLVNFLPQNVGSCYLIEYPLVTGIADTHAYMSYYKKLIALHANK